MRLIRNLMLAGAALAFALSPGLAFSQSQTGLVVKDGAGTSQTLCTFTVSSNQVYCHAEYVWNGSAWVLKPVGAGTATGAPRTVVAQDSTTVAGSASLPAGTNVIGEVGGITNVLNSASLTRPANTTAYGSGQVVCATGPTCFVQVPLSSATSATGTIGRVMLATVASGSAAASGKFVIYLFSAAPYTTGLSDQSSYAGPYSYTSNDLQNYIGSFSCNTASPTNDANSQNFYECAPNSSGTGGNQYKTVSGQSYVYAVIATNGTYAPRSAEAFTVYANSYADK